MEDAALRHYSDEEIVASRINPNQTYLDSWLLRATTQEHQARSLRSTIALACIPVYFLAVTSNYFSEKTLIIAYILASFALLFIDQFYGKKTAAWTYTANTLQYCQIKTAQNGPDSLADITTCDMLYTNIYNAKFGRKPRFDGPTCRLIVALSVGLSIIIFEQNGTIVHIDGIFSSLKEGLLN